MLPASVGKLKPHRAAPVQRIGDAAERTAMIRDAPNRLPDSLTY